MPPSATLEYLNVVFLIQLTVGLGLPWGFKSLPTTQVFFALIGRGNSVLIYLTN